MSGAEQTAKRNFSDLIGRVGAAWGLPEEACRVHALLYVNTGGTTRRNIGIILDLTEDAAAIALDFLQDDELAWAEQEDVFIAHLDPWEALMKGLDQRRSRDLPSMRKSLESCRESFGPEAHREYGQINKLINLVDDLSAIHAQAFKFPPRFLHSLVSVSGRSARFFGGKIS